MTPEEKLDAVSRMIESRGLDSYMLWTLAPPDLFAAVFSYPNGEQAPSDSPIVQFLQRGGARLYRDLIEQHVRHSSVKQLQASILHEVSLLPEHMRSLTSGYVDAVNRALAYDRGFWQSSSCVRAATALWVIAALVFRCDEAQSCCCYPLSAKSHKLAFSLLQICTLSIAYSASLEPKQRKLMGIRKGLFG